jgi:hypothetical protein
MIFNEASLAINLLGCFTPAIGFVVNANFGARVLDAAAAATSSAANPLLAKDSHITATHKAKRVVDLDVIALDNQLCDRRRLQTGSSDQIQFEVNIGANQKSGSTSVTKSAPYSNVVCPAEINKNNWLGGHMYGDTFGVTTTENAGSTYVTAIRTKAPSSTWGMTLRFYCMGSLPSAGPAPTEQPTHAPTHVPSALPTPAPSSPTPAPSSPTQAPTDASQHVITATGTGKQIETIPIPVRIEHVYGHAC